MCFLFLIKKRKEKKNILSKLSEQFYVFTLLTSLRKTWCCLYKKHPVTNRSVNDS